jgi:hypothetical protein
MYRVLKNIKIIFVIIFRSSLKKIIISKSYTVNCQLIGKDWLKLDILFLSILLENRQDSVKNQFRYNLLW